MLVLKFSGQSRFLNVPIPVPVFCMYLNRIIKNMWIRLTKVYTYVKLIKFRWNKTEKLKNLTSPCQQFDVTNEKITYPFQCRICPRWPSSD